MFMLVLVFEQWWIVSFMFKATLSNVLRDDLLK